MSPTNSLVPFSESITFNDISLTSTFVTYTCLLESFPILNIAVLFDVCVQSTLPVIPFSTSYLNVLSSYEEHLFIT